MSVWDRTTSITGWSPTGCVCPANFITPVMQFTTRINPVPLQPVGFPPVQLPHDKFLWEHQQHLLIIYFGHFLENLLMPSVKFGSPHICHVCALLLPINHFQHSWNIFPILENDINSAKLMLVFALWRRWKGCSQTQTFHRLPLPWWQLKPKTSR